jgi:tetratricopeptide (TPR) repeat protein
MAKPDIDMQTEDLEAKAQPLPSSKVCKLGWFFVVIGVIGCGVFATILEKKRREYQLNVDTLSRQVEVLRSQYQSEQKKVREAKESEKLAHQAQQEAVAYEKKTREQIVALGVANDHLLAWMMRDHSKDLPELQKSGNARDILVKELTQFLKLTEGNDRFQAVRARVMMQLAELEIHNRKPAKADKLLDQAVAAWKRSGLMDMEPGHAYRVARARLICLMQALDRGDKELAARLLPKAREAAKKNPANDEVENKRLSAVMHVIDGRMSREENPAKAFKDFQCAIKEMQGIQRTLTEHIIVRSDLARYSLEAATLADELNHVEDARRLRGEAAKALKELLKQNPNLSMPKIQLAKIHIMAASADIGEGRDSEGAEELTKAENLLKGLSEKDWSANGAPMQMAAVKGLRAVLLRDSGKTSEAKRYLEEAIRIMDRIVAVQEPQPGGDNQPLYQLSVLHWQLAGIVGDSGDKKAELAQGKRAADLMETLLQKGAGMHDMGIRRALGYLYGDLGYIAAQQGDKKLAATYYKAGAAIWQSLITKHGKQEEYVDGLKWSQSRYRDVGGK